MKQRPFEKLKKLRESYDKLRQEAKMGGSGATTAGPLAGALPAVNAIQSSNVKTPLFDLLGGLPFGGQALQGIANNAISYQQVAELLQQPAQAELGQQQAAFGQTFQANMIEQEKPARKPVVVEKKDPRARKIVLED